MKLMERLSVFVIIIIGARLIETVAGKKRDLNVYEIGDIYSIGLLK